ncbi:FG-GAP repeat domain-containing protein [Bacteroides sp.]
MKKLFLLSVLCAGACTLNAQTIVDSQSELEKIFVEGPYDFAGLLDDGGGDLWFANGWNVPVITADFNGDGNKDVLVSGNVSFGEVSNPSPANILYLGDGTGKFTVHELPNSGAYYMGAAHYIKIANDRTIVATTGAVSEVEWWNPGFNLGLKNNQKSSLHELSFDASGNPVWTLVKELEDGVCGAGVGLHLYDFDNDGYYDVLISGWIGLPDTEAEVLSEYGSSTQVIYWGDKEGNFTRKTHLENGLAPVADGGSVVADLNGDGYLDVVSVTGKSGKCWNDAGNVEKKGDGSGVFVSINNKNRTFITTTLVKSEQKDGLFFASEGSRVQVGDFNNDGAIDIWFGNNDQVSMDPWRYRGGFFLNDGQGNFTAYNKDADGKDVTPLGVERATPVVADFNQDGNLDLWYNTWLPTSDLDDASKGNNLQALVGVLQLGDGKGGFSTHIFKGEAGVTESTPAMTGYMQRWCSLKTPVYAVADFNNNGVPDIVATSGDAHNGDFKGLTYVAGAAAPSASAVKLPADNTLKGSSVGLSTPEAGKQIAAAYQNGQLVVSGADGERVTIYSVSGSLVYEFAVEGDVCTKSVPLERGFYIVAAGQFRQTVIAQ